MRCCVNIENNFTNNRVLGKDASKGKRGGVKPEARTEKERNDVRFKLCYGSNCDYKLGCKTIVENSVIYSIKGSRKIKNTRDLLITESCDEVVMER